MVLSWKIRNARPWMAATALALMLGSTEAGAEPLNLTIGNLLESTGPLSELGPTSEKAMNLSAQVANKAAKDAGVPATVTLVAADSQGDPQAALSAARTLIDKGASCLVGTAKKPVSISILNGITMQRKITLWPTATSTRLRKVNDDHTIFRTVPADDLQAKALSDTNYLGRIHALWTLDGMNVLDKKTVLESLQNENPKVRATAIRLSEPLLKTT